MGNEIMREDILAVNNILNLVFGNGEFTYIERLGGLTNHTYRIKFVNGQEYAVRLPGKGTEEMINRAEEEKSTRLACDLGIDSDLIYFGKDGTKISKYIIGAVTMTEEELKNEKRIHQMVGVFKKLHNCQADTGALFEVFDMAKRYEKIIFQYNIALYDDYEKNKAKIVEIKDEIDTICDVTKVPCHNDPLCANWILGSEGLYLIDWEYAGMNDRMWDLADVSIEADFDKMLDEFMLKEYFGEKPDMRQWKHFLANKIYVDFLWTLWAKTRVPYDGEPMEMWARERYERMKKNLLLYEECK